MKKLKKICLLTALYALSANAFCFAQNLEWKNDLRSQFLDNKSVIMEINIRSFNSQDIDGDGFIQEDIGEEKRHIH